MGMILLQESHLKTFPNNTFNAVPSVPPVL
jgi:hypothetical protein